MPRLQSSLTAQGQQSQLLLEWTHWPTFVSQVSTVQGLLSSQDVQSTGASTGVPDCGATTNSATMVPKLFGETLDTGVSGVSSTTQPDRAETKITRTRLETRMTDTPSAKSADLAKIGTNKPACNPVNLYQFCVKRAVIYGNNSEL